MGKESASLQETQEKQVQSLDLKDPLEEEMVAYSSVLARENLMDREPGWLQSMGLRSVRHD